MSKTSKDVIEIIKNVNNQGTKPYDTEAEVVRVENDTVWVHIPGGQDETPAQKTISAKTGDIVQVRVANGSAWLVGNASAPPTDDQKAQEAISLSEVAALAAQDAQASAGDAKRAAEDAVNQAGVAKKAADDARQSADDAQQSADDAQQSANAALTGLATVEDVVGVLNWIAEHGEYDLTADTEVIEGKIYFIRSGAGTTADPYVYTPVVNPSGDPSSQGWYELTSVDEAVSNFISSHLALTNAGLYVFADGSEWRVLIASDGVYVLNPAGQQVSKFKNFAQIGLDSGAHSIIDADGQRFYASNGTTLLANIGYGEGASESGTAVAPYYTFGTRAGTIGNYSHAEGSWTTASGYISHAEGLWTTASGYISHAEGDYTTASGDYSHAEGSQTTASGPASHAEGWNTTASGRYSHAQNEGTVSKYNNQTAIGRYNDNQIYTAFEIGNGTNDNNRSNAFTVDWVGDVVASGSITADGRVMVNSGTGGYAGLWTTDSTDWDYPLIKDNGTNIWIGSTQTASTHHTGMTFISSGYDGSSGNDTIYISVPNSGNNNATNYGVWHKGNLPITLGSAMTGLTIGDSTITTQMILYGTSANKVGIGARNNVDNKRYDIRAQADNVGLYNATDSSWVWRLTNISGSVDVGGLTNFLAGNTFTISTGSYSGHISGSSKVIYVFIPLPKQANGRTVTMPKTAVIIRGTSGYVDDSYNTTTVGTTSAYTWTVTGQSNGVKIAITKSTAYTNVTNNTPVSVEFRSSPTLTFS